MSDRTHRHSRRNFLLTLGASGAATAAAAIAKNAPGPVAKEPTDQAIRTASGYRETVHVARYYRTTRV